MNGDDTPSADDPGDRDSRSRDLEIERLLRTSAEAGLKRLLKHCGSEANGMLHRRFGRFLDRSLLEDAYAQAMFEAWHYGATYDSSRGSAASWFGVLCYRSALRILAREGRFDALRRSLAEGLGDSTDPSNQWHAAIDLHAAIANLPNLPRRVILADLAAGGRACGASLEAEIGSREDSIYVARNRGKNMLRAILSGWGYEDGSPRKRARDTVPIT